MCNWDATGSDGMNYAGKNIPFLVLANSPDCLQEVTTKLCAIHEQQPGRQCIYR